MSNLMFAAKGFYLKCIMAAATNEQWCFSLTKTTFSVFICLILLVFFVFLNKYLRGNLSKWTCPSATHAYEKWVAEQVEMTAERHSGSGARIQFRGNKCHRSDSEHRRLGKKKKKKLPSSCGKWLSAMWYARISSKCISRGLTVAGFAHRWLEREEITASNGSITKLNY